MDGFTFRAIATFTCDEGFTLEGDPTRTCQADKNWSGENPRCFSKLADNHNSCLLLLGYPVYGIHHCPGCFVLYYACLYMLSMVKVNGCHPWLKLMGGTRSTPFYAPDGTCTHYPLQLNLCSELWGRH